MNALTLISFGELWFLFLFAIVVFIGTCLGVAAQERSRRRRDGA